MKIFGYGDWNEFSQRVDGERGGGEGGLNLVLNAITIEWSLALKILLG